MADGDRGTLGAFIRRQRELQELSLRRLANLAGISNPYLSQIERGLREPSKRVLDALADTLELSAESLEQYLPPPSPSPTERRAESSVQAAIRADPTLTGRQRQALLEVYAAFTGRLAGEDEAPAAS